MPMNKVMLLLDSWLHGAAQKKPITTWSPKSKCLKRKTVLVRKDLAQIVLVRKDLAQIQIHHDCVSMLVCFRFAILYEPQLLCSLGWVVESFAEVGNDCGKH